MKLKFGLLWIEDSYSAQEESEIREGARAAGFELEIENSRDGSDIPELAERHQKFHVFDLVLLDLNLAEDVKGDELAKEVRKQFRSTPILFYSGSEPESDLRTRMADKRIEGVFCASRNNFTDRAKELIQDYAHTLNRLSGMRGLAVEVVAEVDAICHRVISLIAIDALENLAISMLDDRVCKQSQRNLDEFPKTTTLDEKIRHPASDSMKTFDVFRELLKKHIANMPDGPSKDELRALRLASSDYREKVIGVRNVLGHALEVKNDHGWLILDRDGKEYMTVADFPRYRSEFLDNLEAIQKILEILICQK